jgi:hypothetical protein
MDLPTKAGELLGPWEAVLTVGMVAMVTIDNHYLEARKLQNGNS